MRDIKGSYNISIAHQTESVASWEHRLREVVEATLRQHEVKSARIDLALVDDAEIARLNRLHLGREGPTDVLSFDLSDSGGSDALREGRPPFFHSASLECAIAISVDTAQREAAARRHDVLAELALYAVHGTLHLLGYDDQAPKDADQMHGLEDDILTDVGLGAVFRDPR